MDIVENLAIERAKNCSEQSMQMFSPIQAHRLIWLFFAVMNPGDTFMGMDLAHGGHLSHGMAINMSGKYFNAVPYGVKKEDGYIDYDELTQLARKHKPKLIIAGASAYSREIDFRLLERSATKQAHI